MPILFFFKLRETHPHKHTFATARTLQKCRHDAPRRRVCFVNVPGTPPVPGQLTRSFQLRLPRFLLQQVYMRLPTWGSIFGRPYGCRFMQYKNRFRGWHVPRSDCIIPPPRPLTANAQRTPLNKLVPSDGPHLTGGATTSDGPKAVSSGRDSSDNTVGLKMFAPEPYITSKHSRVHRII